MSKREKKFDAVVRVTFDVKLCDVNELSLKEAVADFKRANGISREGSACGYKGPRTALGLAASDNPKYTISYSYVTQKPTVRAVAVKERK